jgi:hypothetical protein
MSLEKLQQEVEELKNTDVSNFTPDQLNQLIERLGSLLEKSEQTLLNLSITEINKNTNETNSL